MDNKILLSSIAIILTTASIAPCIIGINATLGTDPVKSSKEALATSTENIDQAISDLYIKLANQTSKTPAENTEGTEKPEETTEEPTTPPPEDSQKPTPTFRPQTFTATFEKGAAASISATDRSCTTTQSSPDSCQITTPSITPPENFTANGWRANSSSALVGTDKSVALTRNITYTAVVSENIPEEYLNGDAMLSLVNAERQAQGRSPLTISASLTASARIRAKELCESFSHTRPNGQPFYTAGPNISGENILQSVLDIPLQTVYNSWKESPGHYDNMMHSSYTQIGIAGYNCSSYKWVQLFN